MVSLSYCPLILNINHDKLAVYYLYKEPAIYRTGYIKTYSPLYDEFYYEKSTQRLIQKTSAATTDSRWYLYGATARCASAEIK